MLKNDVDNRKGGTRDNKDCQDGLWVTETWPTEQSLCDTKKKMGFFF